MENGCMVCGGVIPASMAAAVCAECYGTPAYYAAGRRERIADAIKETKAMVAPPNYWASCLAQRAGANPNAAGSIYDGATPEEVESRLLGAEWEEYSHPALQAGTTAFRTNLSGLLGVIELSKLDATTPVVLDDRKGTGTVSATVKGVRGEEVNFTILILGDNEGKEVVFTFHPGDPVRPSSVKTEPGLHGKVITVAEALAMGLTTAKII